MHYPTKYIHIESRKNKVRLQKNTKTGKKYGKHKITGKDINLITTRICTSALGTHSQ